MAGRTNANNYSQNISDPMDSMHRRANTDAMHLQPSRNGANNQNIGDSFGQANILVDDERVMMMKQLESAPGAEQNEDDEDLGLEGIDDEQLRQMMSDPRYAAIFAAHYGNMQQYLRTDEDGFDEDGGQYIDLNNLPHDQQQYFLHHGLGRHLAGDDEDEDIDEEEEEEEEPTGMRGIVGKGNGVGFFAEGDEDEGMLVQFNENAQALQQRFEYDEEGRMLPEAESDYCEDLGEIIILNGTDDDVVRYKAIHLMDKGANYNLDDNGGEKFQCPDTGAHFEFLEMVRRLKRLQTLRGGIDKLIEEQLQRLLQSQKEAAAAKLQQKQQMIVKQQQQVMQASPGQIIRTTEPFHKRNDSAKRNNIQSMSGDNSNESAKRQASIGGNIQQMQFIEAAQIRQQPQEQFQQQQQKPRPQIKQVDANLFDKHEVNGPPPAETSSGVYSVYGGAQVMQQRVPSAGKNGPLKVIQANAGGGYLNTQQPQHNFETEATPHHISDGYASLATQAHHQREDEEMLRQQQMLLMQTENDEDEIVDLLGSQGSNEHTPGHFNHMHGHITHGSKMHQQVPLQTQASHHQPQLSIQQQQRKPPMTGTKNKKSISSGQKVYQPDMHSHQMAAAGLCYTEVREVDERPNRAQQIAYNNFFKVGPQEQQQIMLSAGNHGKRNQQLDIKTQKDMELLALSQQFLQQHNKLQGPNRNQQHQQYATHTYFANNHHMQQQQQHQQQRASKRQASASGGLGGVGFMSGQKQQASKKTRTGSTSQAFNTHYGGANTQSSNNRASNKFISTAAQGAPAPPIVMVMNPSKQTQIQNILMNFYQNTNSRASHHQHYDQRLYPTRVSNKHSTTASMVVGKGGKGAMMAVPQQQQQQIIVHNTDPSHVAQSTKIVTSSSHHTTSQQQQHASQQQFKSFTSIPQQQQLQHYATTSQAATQQQQQQNMEMMPPTMDRKHVMTIQKLHSKQLVMKKPGSSATGGQRNQANSLGQANTIDSTTNTNNRQSLPGQMQMGLPAQQIVIQRESTSNGSDSRPQSAIKKKNSGISPNSKALKQLQLLNSRQKPSSKPYHQRYDILNPSKYKQFKSRDAQHKKTNSFSVGGLAAAFQTYSGSSKNGKGHAVETGLYSNNQLGCGPHGKGHHQMYSTVENLQHQQQQQQQQQMLHGATFIEPAESLMLGGTPSSNNQGGTKRSLILNSQQTNNSNNLHVYDISPPTQKTKSTTLTNGQPINITTGSGSMIQKIASTSKSRQPNHIISCGGIISNKLGSATVQQEALSKMDMNSIIKKLAVRKNGDYHGNLLGGVPSSFVDANTRYASGQHQHAMSFAGKKITAVNSNGHHQVDATKRLSVNLHAGGFVNKVAASNAAAIAATAVAQSSNGFQQQQMMSVPSQSSKVRTSHSKGKSTSSGFCNMVQHQSRQSSIVPKQTMNSQQAAAQSKSTKRINHGSMGGAAALFASNKKGSNRVSSGISYDYRSSERRCDTVQ